MSFRSTGKLVLFALLGCQPVEDPAPVSPSTLPRWTFQQRLPTSSDLRAVRFSDAQTGWVAGEATTILETRDGGATWTQREHSPVDRGGDVAALDFATDKVVLAAGSEGPPAGRWWVTNDGVNWVTPSGASGFAPFTSVDVVSTDSAYTLAGDGKIRVEKAGSAVTRDAGAGTWLGVRFAGLTGYVVGSGIKKTPDDGVTWTPPPASPTAQTLRGISLVSATEVFACGDAGTVVKTTNGTDWVDVSTGLAAALRGVFFIDALTGWVVGDGGVVRKTVDGGASWITPTTTGTFLDLYDVWFPTASVGYAVGNLGTVIKTTDGGLNWTDLSRGYMVQLNAVDFTRDGVRGVAVGNGGLVLRTTNGGATWTYSDSGVTVDLHGVSVPPLGSGDVAYACGANRTILKTADLGATAWTTQTSTPGGATLRDILFPSGDIQPGYCVGDSGTVLKTSNGGSAWNAQAVPAGDFTSIDAPGVGQTVYVAGLAGAVAVSDLFGTTWGWQPVPSGTDLLSIASPPSPNGDTAYAGGVDQNVYRTLNSGALWQAFPAGITPRALFFTGPGTGWAAGEEIVYLSGTTWLRSYDHTRRTLRGLWVGSSGLAYAVGDGGTILKTTTGGK